MVGTPTYHLPVTEGELRFLQDLLVSHGGNNISYHDILLDRIGRLLPHKCLSVHDVKITLNDKDPERVVTLRCELDITHSRPHRRTLIQGHSTIFWYL